MKKEEKSSLEHSGTKKVFKIVEKSLHNSRQYVIIVFVRENKPACRNWQTRQTQNLLAATSCGFKSRRRHYFICSRIFKSVQIVDFSMFVRSFCLCKKQVPQIMKQKGDVVAPVFNSTFAVSASHRNQDKNVSETATSRPCS